MRTLAPFVALSLFAACRSTPAPAPLVVLTTFAVDYTGRIAPIAEPGAIEDLNAFPAAAPGDDAWHCRATVVELPKALAYEWLPLIAEGSEPPARIGAPQRVPTVLGSVVAGKDLHHTLHALDGAIVLETMPIAVAPAATAVRQVADHCAYVAALDLKAITAQRAIVDPCVRSFRYGQRFEFSRDPSGEAFTFVWHIEEPVTPIPVVKTRYALMQAPMLVRHAFRGTVTLQAGQGLVIGSVPGRDDEHVRVLCVDVLPTAPSQ